MSVPEKKTNTDEFSKDLSFQQSLKALEEIVDRLEGGELSLEESLLEFEKGVKLARKLQSVLARAEQKVQEIMKEDEPQD